MARALAWHARGHEFDSRILHEEGSRRVAFFVLVELRLELVTSEALLCQRRVWEECKDVPKGVPEHPEFDSRILHEEGSLVGQVL